ncbi:hypothetical protein COU88_02930 [Candidatus Roizmanbacteria bacterium CG10_big_fil_rev_8_21_14_0_10_39_6]|uniref:Uncharacterized protein n=1 Tax=Candidatus Roizmanbacteria bacterium CG10_big_fil_rev_8_21_14_0_10_39_6 TaxID=1974853 RepID=A0A2M8KSG0_9BACT|nr:MAG: hypothetical protein COU88_02930 [Candidatus Roizmanbacteria bacterium CG10_big_fil_rev_8_21_14_0_10_39_6]
MSVETTQDDYYEAVFGSHGHVSPDSLPPLIIDETKRGTLLRGLGKNPEVSVPFAVRKIANYYLPESGGSIKIGAVPTVAFNTRAQIPIGSGWGIDVDMHRRRRMTHPAYNTLVFTYYPRLGPYIIVQEGFTVTSAEFPHVEVTRYELALIGKTYEVTNYDSGIRMAGSRVGRPHQHFTDAFGDWSRLDLTPDQIERAQLPKFRKKIEFRLPKSSEVSRLATLLTMCLEQNQLEYPMIKVE